MNAGVRTILRVSACSKRTLRRLRPERCAALDQGLVCRLPCVRSCSSAAMPSPHIEGSEKTYPQHIHQIVTDISKLTLLEVADLNELLKKTLNIPDAPMMAMGAMPAAAPQAEEEEEEAGTPTKTSFTVKLTEFDTGKKVALIKEIKSIMTGMNLVQAKKFVESAPTDVKADLTKDEAEALQKQLEAVGAKVEIE